MLEGIKAKKYLYGFKKEADFSEKLETKLIGGFNMYNVLAVYASLVLLGMDKEKVKEQIKNVLPPRGRFDHFMSKNGVLVIVDYAHTPDALEKVLLTVKEILPAFGGEKSLDGSPPEAGKLISLFGCGGNKDPFKRPIMGKIGAINSDISIFTADNPRNEDPEDIIKQMKESLSAEELKKVISKPIRHEAILEAVKIAQKGDIILAAGKGHENSQEIKGVRTHFDDMEEFQKAYN
jgi:UDP-N-acetylmuramoyl-L-alanyl-D-glutamate--2,6-diaminopimelate ligase